MAVSNAEVSLKEAGKRLFDIVLKEVPENAECLEGSGEIVVNAAVTVDDTWQRRGCVSQIGVVFVLSVLTGKVLNYQVKSLFLPSRFKAKTQT